MPAILRIEHGKTYRTFREFIRAAPPCSIAIDGIVAQPTQYYPNGPYLNLNHHDGCDRLATRSACEQAVIYMRSGLNKQFRLNGEYNVIVYANHPDQDVCLAWFILKHPELCTQTMHPLLNRLISVEGALDTTAGAYPFPEDLPLLGEIAWVFEPYTRAKQQGILYQPDVSEHTMISIVTDVENRIMRHITGNGESILLDTRYTLVDKIGSVAIIEEIGQHARTGVYSDGHQAFMSIKELPDGFSKCTVGRMSAFVQLNLEKFAHICNRQEGLSGSNVWGGGNNIIGSPRQGGTKLAMAALRGILINCIIR